VLTHRVTEEVHAALAVADDESASPVERAEMLMEIALGLQQRPKSPEQLHAAVELYDKALAVCPDAQELLRARITARKGTALQAIPEEGTECLEGARAEFETALPILTQLGTPEEVAEAEMNLGVVVQALTGASRAHSIRKSSPFSRTILPPRFCRCRSPMNARRCARRLPCKPSRKA